MSAYEGALSAAEEEMRGHHIDEHVENVLGAEESWTFLALRYLHLVEGAHQDQLAHLYMNCGAQMIENVASDE